MGFLSNGANLTPSTPDEIAAGMTGNGCNLVA